MNKENQLIVMRLSGKQIQTIKNVALSVFGQETKIFLFGSRLDDTKKGGDIDLFIKPNQIVDGEYSFEMKLKFLVQLKKVFGERKIDVIIDNNNSTFVNEIILTSIQL